MGAVESTGAQRQRGWSEGSGGVMEKVRTDVVNPMGLGWGQ